METSTTTGDETGDELVCDAYNDDPTRVGRVARRMPRGKGEGDEPFERVAVVLKAVADPVRARIVYALTVEPLCVCELATLLGMGMNAVSHHLKTLSLSGLIYARKEGKFACYRLRDTEEVQAAVTLLAALIGPTRSERENIR